MRLDTAREARKPSGFGRVMNGLNEREARQKFSEQMDQRITECMRLKEKFEKTPGLGFGKGKLDEMFQKDSKKAQNLLMFLDQTERGAMANPILMENYRQQVSLKEAYRLTEDMQTSGFLGVTPQDIVKISRIAYPNSVAPDLFDFWGMSSMKDSLYKLETLIGSTARGSTQNDVVYEKYGEGRYPSEWEEETVTIGAPGVTFSGVLDYVPCRPFKVEVYLNDKQVGQDNGSGIVVGSELNPAGVNTVVYAGGAYTLTFLAPLAITDVLIIRYAYDSEQSSLFTRTGSVLLNLVVYDYRANPWPLAIEWSRFTEELMQSKVGMSAKEQLLAGAADIFRKSMDEFCVDKAIKASNWTTAETFDTDFTTAGSDSAMDHAQNVLSAIVRTEMKTYKSLGRQADKTNMVVDSNSYVYLTKHRLFNPVNVASKIGIYKAGELAGRDVYIAPPNVVPEVANTGTIHLFGRSNDTLNVDSVVSVGTWKAGLTTDPVELKNFNSQMGMMFLGDIKTNNRQFATKLTLQNLTANS